MRKRIKVITMASSRDLEKEVNRWVEDNESNYVIINLTFKVTTIGASSYFYCFIEYEQD